VSGWVASVAMDGDLHFLLTVLEGMDTHGPVLVAQGLDVLWNFVWNWM
jgi:hypothetical protein